MPDDPKYATSLAKVDQLCADVAPIIDSYIDMAQRLLAGGEDETIIISTIARSVSLKPEQSALGVMFGITCLRLAKADLTVR